MYKIKRTPAKEFYFILRCQPGPAKWDCIKSMYLNKWFSGSFAIPFHPWPTKYAQAYAQSCIELTEVKLEGLIYLTESAYIYYFFHKHNM